MAAKVTEAFLTKVVSCAFCDRKATDFINTGDLDHNVVKLEGLPQSIKDGVYHTAIPLCDKHFYKHITHPQLVQSRKEIRSSSDKKKKKTNNKQKKNKK